MVATAPDTKPRRKHDLTEGSVTGHILRMWGPFAVAVVALLSAGLVDTFYLGNLGGKENPELGTLALAAVGFAYPLTFLGNSANIGLGAGTMSAVSRANGAGDEAKGRRHAAAAILFALLVMTILVTVMYLLMPWVLNLLGAEGEVRASALAYLAISLPGLAIVSVAMICNNILRAGGEALMPSSIMILGAVINIILDPFLIFGWGPFPRLEVPGAALATVIGNTVAAIFGFYIVRYRRHATDFANMGLRSIRHAWATVASVGLPAAVTNMVVPAGTTLAVAAIARILGSEKPVAAFTLASRAELLSVALLYALSACIGAVTGQNGGAGRTDRVEEAFRVCYRICLFWGTVAAIPMFLFARQVADIFTNDPEVLDMAVPYFQIVPITIFAYGFVFISAAGFNALGRPLFGLIYTVIRSLVLFAPAVAIGAMVGGLSGAFIGIAIANIVSGVIAYLWSLRRAPMTAKAS